MHTKQVLDVLFTAYFYTAALRNYLKIVQTRETNLSRCKLKIAYTAARWSHQQLRLTHKQRDVNISCIHVMYRAAYCADVTQHISHYNPSPVVDIYRRNRHMRSSAAPAQ